MECWATLIEKALIKAYGSYEDAFASNVSMKDIMRDLTGGKVEEYVDFE